MLLLLEIPLGFALFKVLDERKLSTVDIWDWSREFFSSADSARQVVNLKGISMFVNTPEESKMLINGKPSRRLRELLCAHCDNGEKLGVADSDLGQAIWDNLKIDTNHGNAVMELMRGVRSHFMELIAGFDPPKLATTTLDVETEEALVYMDSLDQAVSTYAMRLKKMYGPHFPELESVVKDNISYARAVKLMGCRTNLPDIDFSQMLTKEVEKKLKKAARNSWGIALSNFDLRIIEGLCDQVLSAAEYGFQQLSLLKNRMKTIAPNLTVLVGAFIAARLIVLGGSLLKLAKMHRTRIQFLGAKKRTLNYGLLYDATLITHVPPKQKFTILRILAAKTLLAIRYDALGDGQDKSIGMQYKLQVKAHIRNLGRKKRAGAKITAAEICNSMKKVKRKAEEKAEEKKKYAEAKLWFNQLLREEELEEAGEEAPKNGEKKGEEEDG